MRCEVYRSGKQTETEEIWREICAMWNDPTWHNEDAVITLLFARKTHRMQAADLADLIGNRTEEDGA